MGICQIIYSGIMFMGLGLAIAKHGKTETRTTNFWVVLISYAIQFALLWFGGFYK